MITRMRNAGNQPRAFAERRGRAERSELPTFAAVIAAAATVGRRERLVHRSFSEGGSAPAQRRARARPPTLFELRRGLAEALCAKADAGESEGRSPSAKR